MKDLLSSPILWLALSIFAYEIGLRINRHLRSPFVNPLLLAAALLIILLFLTGTDLNTYKQGGGFISLFLTPATVALAVPVYRQIDTLRRYLLPILLGALVGSITSVASVIIFCRLFGLSDSLTASLIPKSVTTPIGIELSQNLGGIPSVTVIAIIFTGLIGAAALPSFLKLLHMDNSVVRGVAIGTASHAVGTARAIELGETEGAMSGLSIGVAGLITVIIAAILPLLFPLFLS